MSVAIVAITRTKISVSPDGERITAVKPVLLRTSTKVCHLGLLALLQNVKSTLAELLIVNLQLC